MMGGREEEEEGGGRNNLLYYFYPYDLKLKIIAASDKSSKIIFVPCSLDSRLSLLPPLFYFFVFPDKSVKTKSPSE